MASNSGPVTTNLAKPRPSHTNEGSLRRIVNSGNNRTVTVGIAEVTAISGIEVRLHRQALGQKHVMAGQFHMVIGDFIHRSVGNGDVVDQITHRDQHTTDEDSVIRR